MSVIPALEDVQKLYGSDVKKIYGPYINNDDRHFVILYYQNLKTKTISLPKLILELSIGRCLINDETCDHIDGNYYNNKIDNLRILSRKENGKQGSVPAQISNLICAYCGKEFTRQTREIKRYLRIGRTKFYCKKSCAGMAGK